MGSGQNFNAKPSKYPWDLGADRARSVWGPGVKRTGLAHGRFPEPPAAEDLQHEPSGSRKISSSARSPRSEELYIVVFAVCICLFFCTMCERLLVQFPVPFDRRLSTESQEGSKTSGREKKATTTFLGVPVDRRDGIASHM